MGRGRGAPPLLCHLALASRKCCSDSKSTVPSVRVSEPLALRPSIEPFSTSPFALRAATSFPSFASVVENQPVWVCQVVGPPDV